MKIKNKYKFLAFAVKSKKGDTMKKVLALAVVALLFAGSQAYAQWFVGGGVGFNTVKDGETSFSVSPEAGYAYNEKVDFGLGFSYSSLSDGTESFSDGNFGNYTLSESSSFKIAPFARYNFINFGKFKFLLKGEFAIVSRSETLVGEEALYDQIEDDYYTVATEREVSGSGFEINVIPMVTYDLSEKIVIFAGLNFLSMNFSSLGGDYDTTSFGFGADSNNVANTDYFQIGFNYKF